MFITISQLINLPITLEGFATMAILNLFPLLSRRRLLYYQNTHYLTRMFVVILIHYITLLIILQLKNTCWVILKRLCTIAVKIYQSGVSYTAYRIQYVATKDPDYYHSNKLPPYMKLLATSACWVMEFVTKLWIKMYAGNMFTQRTASARVVLLSDCIQHKKYFGRIIVHTTSKVCTVLWAAC